MPIKASICTEIIKLDYWTKINQFTAKKLPQELNVPAPCFLEALYFLSMWLSTDNGENLELD